MIFKFLKIRNPPPSRIIEIDLVSLDSLPTIYVSNVHTCIYDIIHLYILFLCLSTNELKTIVCPYILFVVKIDRCCCCSILIFSLDILFILSNSLFVQYSRIMLLLFVSICNNIYIIRIVVFLISDNIDECRPNDRKCRRDSAKMTKKIPFE